MNSYIADHIKKLPKSGIRDFFELVIGMDDVLSLGVGEPDFSTPWNIREATIYALEIGKTMYTSNRGLLTLRNEISKYANKHFNIKYNPENEIIITTGVSEALDLAVRAITCPGDEIIYHEPCYVSYAAEISMAFGKGIPIITTSKEDFIIDPQKIANAITPKTKAIMLNYPNNPTGAVLPKDVILKLKNIIQKHNLIVISDEIYSELNYKNQTLSLASFPEIKDKIIYLNGFSKSYAMTGYRIGYACGHSDIIEAMMKIHQYSMLCAPILAQEAAIEALKNSETEKNKMKEEYNTRRNFIYNYLTKKIGLSCFQPYGAFYIFPSIKKTGLSSTEFCKRLLAEEKVAVVPGNAFGESGEGFIRISYATSIEEIELAMQKMQAFIKRL